MTQFNELREEHDIQWIQEGGDKIWINDMSHDHVKNCLRMMIRRFEECRGFSSEDFVRRDHNFFNDDDWFDFF